MRMTRSSAWKKYWLLQIPGWIIIGIVLFWLFDLEWIPLWAAIGVFILWILKDFLLYPFLRLGYESHERTGAEELIGARGIARERLDPQGYIRVRGELWRAEVDSGHPPVLPGSPVKIIAAQGLRLRVTADHQDHD